MITEDYISFEVAKLLKEKGFEGFTMFSYSARGTTMCGHWENEIDWLPKCTLQMAMKWLREREKLAYNILIVADGDLGNLHYLYEIQEIDNELLKVNGSIGDIENQRFDTYEEAVEEAIKYCLEHLI